MHIEEILRSVTMTGTSTFFAEVSDDWTQGRTLFGGLQAMLAVYAMRLSMPSAPPLWSVQTTFIAPVPSGTVHGEVRTLRAGRSAIQIEARLKVEGECACLVVAVFGVSRTSAVAVEPQHVSAPLLGAEASREFPFIRGVTPNFTQHYAYRWAEGGFPFSGSKVPGTRIHLRQADTGKLGEAQVVALADAIPPPMLSLLEKLTPASSLTWTLELVQHLPPVSSTEWWRMDACIISARDGYSSQDASLYGPDGTLVALSRQVVALFG